MTVLIPTQQIELFKGCVYLLDKNKIRLPNGTEVRRQQFDVIFGGRVFMMDNANQRTTRSAWEAFTQSEALQPPLA